MPAWGPVKRGDLVRHLRTLGFTGPFAGGKHQYVVRGDLTLHIPNPHAGDIGVGLLTQILRQAGVARAEWEALR